MANTLKLKRSSAAGVVPTVGQLQLGELAINAYDGRLFSKKNNGNADALIEFAALGNANTWSQPQTFSAGAKIGAPSWPTYSANIDFGGDVAGTWRKIVTAVCANETYSTVTFRIDVVDPNSNHGTDPSVSPDLESYFVACQRTYAAVLDTPDLCLVRGPSNRIRAVKTSTGTYEIQIQNEAQYREYLVLISVIASNHAHTITYHDGSAAGAAGSAQYAASIGDSVIHAENIKAWKGISCANTALCANLNADLLDGYHVGTSGSTIPRLDTANTWSTTQTSSLASGGNHVLLWNGVNTRTVIHRTDAAQYYVMLSDANAAPSGTYNALRPLRINLTSGLAAMENGLQVWGLTAKDAATFDAGLVAYSATNDYTTATVKLGYATGTYLAIHGGTSGNFVTHYVPDASSTPFQIDLKTQTKSWKFEYAVTDGFLIPGQGIRWLTSTGTGAPTVTTRSAGSRVVLYPAVGASTVDYAFGYDTNTLWSSIPQQTGRCYKWYAGTTVIAALHGDGNHFVYDPGLSTQDTTATLTVAQIRKGIIQSTPTAGITLTLPTSSNMDNTLWDGGTGMDWSIINLSADGSKTVTLAGNTNHTITGNTVVAINTSARFRTIKSIYEQNGLPVFTTYRIS